MGKSTPRNKIKSIKLNILQFSRNTLPPELLPEPAVLSAEVGIKTDILLDVLTEKIFRQIFSFQQQQDYPLNIKYEQAL